MSCLPSASVARTATCPVAFTETGFAAKSTMVEQSNPLSALLGVDIRPRLLIDGQELAALV